MPHAPWGRRGPGPIAPVLVAAAVTLACTEDPLSVPGDAAPGASSPTLEVSVDASELSTWRDTTYSGFALPTNASFSVVASGSELDVRTFARLNVPDTVTTFADTLPATSYDSLEVLIAIDTVTSEFTDFPVTLRLVSLAQGFSLESVSWVEAELGRPWTTPGGDLGTEIGAVEIAEVGDSLVIESSVSTDSLLKAWRESDGENGFALLVEGPDARIRVQSIRFAYEATLEGREIPVEQVQLVDTRTFATDPPAPVAGTALRLGGLPSSRFYLQFVTPQSIEGVPLAGATINFAELVFQPLAPPSSGFALERPLTTRPITLLADPFELGPKTPVGSSPGSPAGLQPDSLAAGNPVRLDISALLSSAVRDSSVLIRLGVRPIPDAQALGFWEFGSVEAPPQFRPRLRVILTPPADFELPS